MMDEIKNKKIKKMIKKTIVMKIKKDQIGYKN